MSKSHDSEPTRELNEDELSLVSGGAEEQLKLRFSKLSQAQFQR
jgi:bacteriocin-like protein